MPTPAWVPIMGSKNLHGLSIRGDHDGATGTLIRMLCQDIIASYPGGEATAHLPGTHPIAQASSSPDQIRIGFMFRIES